MRERPILMNAPMVRAILDGSKTQTRRVMKHQPGGHHWDGMPGYKLQKLMPLDAGCAIKFAHSIPQNKEWDDATRWMTCPYGSPGERLWVRETARCIAEGMHGGSNKKRFDVDYKAGGGTSFEIPIQPQSPAKWFPSINKLSDGSPRWQPAIHMPRWASRITLEVTEVRVEKLQDISEGDACAEGMPSSVANSPRVWYASLWNQINGDGAWDANPWVWCVSFKKV